MNPLRQRIQEDVKAAMRSRDKPRLVALRLITAALKQKEIDERIDLDETSVIAILDKMAKQIRDSIQQFKQAGREDLVTKETFDLSIIQTYLPAQLSASEIQRFITEAIAHTGAESAKNMGQVMAMLKPRLQGRADMGAVARLVKQTLG